MRQGRRGRAVQMRSHKQEDVHSIFVILDLKYWGHIQAVRPQALEGGGGAQERTGGAQEHRSVGGMCRIFTKFPPSAQRYAVRCWGEGSGEGEGAE